MTASWAGAAATVRSQVSASRVGIIGIKLAFLALWRGHFLVGKRAVQEVAIFGASEL
jgi:hypothetical protein